MDVRGKDNAWIYNELSGSIYQLKALSIEQHGFYHQSFDLIMMDEDFIYITIRGYGNLKVWLDKNNLVELM